MHDEGSKQTPGAGLKLWKARKKSPLSMRSKENPDGSVVQFIMDWTIED